MAVVTGELAVAMAASAFAFSAASELLKLSDLKPSGQKPDHGCTGKDYSNQREFDEDDLWLDKDEIVMDLHNKRLKVDKINS